jgi:mitochondrial cardiolipin hydrolase
VLYTLFTEGVDVRIITDDETTGAEGCDIQNLANAGIPIRNDNNLQARMHHKFIVIDDELLMNGSFNWTITAVKYNNENVVVTSDPLMIKNFKNVIYT